MAFFEKINDFLPKDTLRSPFREIFVVILNFILPFAQIIIKSGQSSFYKILDLLNSRTIFGGSQVAAGSNQIFTGSIDGVDNISVKNFDCCFLRQILTTVMLKIEKYGLRVLIWAEVQPLIDVLALP